MSQPEAAASVRAAIRQRYARAADLLLRSAARKPADPVFLETGTTFGSAQYSPSRLSRVPIAAIASSLGCGDPTSAAALRSGQRVLDVGCGGGLDALLAARSVCPDGLVVGVDIVAEMVGLARENARRGGVVNARFAVGSMEMLPFGANVFDIVIANSSLSLTPDMPLTMREIARVLSPAGRLHAVDVVADDDLSITERMGRAAETGCTAGAQSFVEYERLLRHAGFVAVEMEISHIVADRMFATRIAARKPS